MTAYLLDAWSVTAPFLFWAALAAALVALHDWVERGLRRRALRLATARLRKRVGS